MVTTSTTNANEFDREHGNLGYRRAWYRRQMPASAQDLAVTAFIGNRLLAEHAKRKAAKVPGGWRAIADDYSLTSAHVQKVAGGATAGPKVVQAFADVHFGGSIDKLKAAAMTFAAEHPEAVDPSATPKDPKEVLRRSFLWEQAGPVARERFDALRPYTQTPNGERLQRSVIDLTSRLVAFIEDEREGIEAPPGAVRDEPHDPDVTPPSRRPPRAKTRPKAGRH